MGTVRGPRAGAELERACGGLARMFMHPRTHVEKCLKVEGPVSKVRGSLGGSSWSQRGHRWQLSQMPWDHPSLSVTFQPLL